MCPILYKTIVQYLYLSILNSVFVSVNFKFSNWNQEKIFTHYMICFSAMSFYFLYFFLYFSKENNKNKMMQNSLFHILQIHNLDFYTLFSF